MSTQSFDTDFAVIGSGFGGSVSAMRLAEKGYDVVILEQGRRYRQKEFPKTNWNIRKFLWLPSAGCFGIFRMTLMSDVFILSGAGVGGGSLVYANTLYVPPDPFFESTVWPEGKDWKEALLPHYRMAQYMLGVNQNCFEGKGDAILKEVAEDLGKGDTYVRTPVGVYFGEANKEAKDPYFGGAGPDRTGCNFCGGCMVGCRFGAKNTLDKNYLYFAEKLGAEIRPERTVVDIKALEGGGYEVTHERSGSWLRKDRQVLRARQVVLSAGVLGTVKLLLESKLRGSLPQVSDKLGSFVRTNSEAILGASSRDKDVDFSRGLAITSSIHPDDHTHVELVRYSRGSDALATISTILTDGKPGKSGSRVGGWIKNILRRPTDFLRTLSPFGWAHRTIILLVMQTLDNATSLKLKRSWRSLWRRELDTGSEGSDVPTYIPLANQIARSVGEKNNGIPISSVPEVLFDVPTTAHILGGAVMGRSPQEGVIDEHNQVFGHPGLYVCDGSMIPANLGVNPSLTITAMSEHAMSQIPVKDGKTLQHAIDPAWTSARLEERQMRALESGNPNLHPVGTTGSPDDRPLPKS